MINFINVINDKFDKYKRFDFIYQLSPHEAALKSDFDIDISAR